VRKLVASTFVTLDGVMEAPGSEERPGDMGGWSMPYFSPDMGAATLEALRACDALLLGRVTYEHFAAAWPAITDEDGFAELMNGLPKYVVSRTLRNPAWSNSTVLAGDLGQEVERLKAEPGRDILVQGSGELVRGLSRLGLVDEYQVFVHPIVLGRGKRLFDAEQVLRLRLVDSRAFSGGVAQLTYRRAES
jgi:dihydrofolate reductase